MMHLFDMPTLSVPKTMFDYLPTQTFWVNVQPQRSFDLMPIMLLQCVHNDGFLVLLHEGTEAGLIDRHWKSPVRGCVV